jgi:prepilin-type N-terminal cleavage/methylation domain-containing protein
MMMSRHKHPPAHGLSRQAGVTLFEILVTMFVLSIALLSLAQ